MRTEEFDYALPQELIAQSPVPRGESRLLVLHCETGVIEHRAFADLREYLEPGDTLALNETRVTARRLEATRSSGKPAELLLLGPVGETDWEALVRPGRRLLPGTMVTVREGGAELAVEVVAVTAYGGRILRCTNAAARNSLCGAGVVPLPPYIHARLEDEERYQTVYAAHGGSAAAPTAGLHFTSQMLRRIEADGVAVARITLDVGIDTFRPVKAETLEGHVMHGERFRVSACAAETINATNRRVFAVGTTVVRALESAADEAGHVEPGEAETRLFIRPGYTYRVVDALLTNFHLPRSTLLMLVSAFGGRQRVMEAYREAVSQRYRFYSFGDAMLLI